MESHSKSRMFIFIFIILCCIILKRAGAQFYLGLVGI
uniref:Uncharacterized protein n=1 Tax=Parascaris equorum TaxID=6256 RepID=A0A914R9Z6_PAREQ